VRTVAPLLVLCVALLAVAAPSSRGAPAQNPCGIPDQRPLWIDFGDGSVPFWSTIFKRPGIIVAATGLTVTPQYRAAGVPVVYFDLYLKNRVGTPSGPADPSTVPARANALFDRAVQATGCGTPYVALNELFGANLATPVTPTTAQYRANVLAFVQTLATRGARTFVLVPTAPYVGGDGADWFRELARYVDLVPEVYFPAPTLSKAGPVLANRRIRTALRQRVADFADLGIPVSRIGVMLGFQSAPGAGGREGLQPASKWFEVVKWQALSARQVSAELKLGSVWSWGWAAFTTAGQDSDKQAAACVYLWARDSALCNGPAAAGPGFDTSRTTGQLTLPPGAVCSVGSATISSTAVTTLAQITRDREAAISALVQRAVLADAATASPQDVLTAERLIVATRFDGSRSAYAAALARARTSIAVGRSVLADELRRRRLAASLRVPSPSGAAVASYAATYGAQPAREVLVAPAAPWLGGRTSGIALTGLAPPAVLDAEPGARTAVRTLDGTYTVRALGETAPLAAFPISLARPAIVQALVDQARDDALHGWLVSRLHGALNSTTCLDDRLPEVADVDLVDALPFLSLP